MIQGVFCDIDGTLLTRQGTIRRSTRKALQEVQAQGIVFGVATGRAPFQISRVLKGLPVDVTISYNGSLVYEGDECIYERHFSQVAIQQMTDFFDAENRQAIFCSKTTQQGSFTIRFGHLYYIAKLLTFLPEWLPTHTLRYLLQKWSPNRRKNRYHQLSILKQPIFQCVLFCSERETDYIKEKLPACDILRSNRFSVDIVPKGANKKVGLEKYAATRQMALTNLMVFGDQQNDEGMIQAAGIGVAMGNAQPEVKGVADYITNSHQKDGIRQALEHYRILPTR